jgi:hypothetical protein
MTLDELDTFVTTHLPKGWRLSLVFAGGYLPEVDLYARGRDRCEVHDRDDSIPAKVLARVNAAREEEGLEPVSYWARKP